MREKTGMGNYNSLSYKDLDKVKRICIDLAWKLHVNVYEYIASEVKYEEKQRSGV